MHWLSEKMLEKIAAHKPYRSIDLIFFLKFSIDF